jgi:NADH-quinone oxidoreductase subunit G
MTPHKINPFNHDIPAPDTPLVNVHFNGQWIQVPKGTNVVEVTRQQDKFLPHYCYHPKLSISGNCRMCLFEMGTPKMDAERKPVTGADGKPEIAWIPRPQIGCATQVTEGMGIRTESPMAVECRKGVMELLLINHPLDCPICDQAGECKLQEFSSEYGNGYSRFVENKVKKPKNVDLGKNIVLDDERCILCSRCVRFAKEIAKDDVLGFVQRGSYNTLTAHPGKRFDNAYSLNTVDICPVGALTSKDFRFKMRVWFLKETKSISTWDGTGSNIIIGSRENKIYRVTPRENEEVNSCWMPDEARFEFHADQRADRYEQPMANVKGHFFPSSWNDIVPRVAQELKKYQGTEIAIIGSARQTNEELFLLKSLATALGVTLLDVLPRPQEADDFLISKDGNPNTQGAELLQVSQQGKKLKTIAEAIESGRIKSLISVLEDPLDCGVSLAALDKLSFYVHLGTVPTKTTHRANFILASAGFGEKRGSMINVKGRLQRLNKAVSCPGQAMEDWEILRDLKAAIGGGNGLHSIEDVFKAMSLSCADFAGLSLSRIGDLGIQLCSASGVAVRESSPVKSLV